MKLAARRDQIKALLAKGLSARKIAEQVGCAPSTVYRINAGQGARKDGRAAYRTISAKVTKKECDALDRLVKQGAAPSRSALMRQMARLAGDFYAPTADEQAFLDEADRHLRHLGGNFNQIAFALSTSLNKTGSASPSSSQIEMMRTANREIQQLRFTITSMLHRMQIKNAAVEARLHATDDDDDDY